MFEFFRMELSQAGSAGSGGGGGGGITAVNSGTNITVNTVGTVATVNLNDIVSLTHADDGSTQGQYQFNSMPFLHNYGLANTFLGENSGNFTLTIAQANQNVCIGYISGGSLTTGGQNVIIGSQAGASLTSGNNNIFIGTQIGTSATTEAGNIWIGVDGMAAETNTTRIGTGKLGCYISGIASIPTSNSQMVTIDTTTDQLGSAPIPGFNFNITNVSTTPFDVVYLTDYYLSVDTSSLAITIRLPDLTNPSGGVFVIKDATGNASVNNITVTTSGGTVLIDGSTAYTMNTNYQSVNVIYNGTTTAYEVW